jgi:hypothetical protein
MPLTKFTTADLLNELNKRNPWLDRGQTAKQIGDCDADTLRKRDKNKSHDLKAYKFGKNGRVKYRWLDVQEHVRKQQLPD